MKPMPCGHCEKSGCRFCLLYKHKAKYRNYWQGKPVQPTSPTVTESPVTLVEKLTKIPLPCNNLGGYTGDLIACPTCQGQVKVKVMECSVYGRCTIQKKAGSLHCCVGCLSYTPLQAETLSEKKIQPTAGLLSQPLPLPQNPAPPELIKLQNHNSTLDAALKRSGVNPGVINPNMIAQRQVGQINPYTRGNPPNLPPSMSKHKVQGVHVEYNHDKPVWAYGVQTVSSRMDTLLPKTIESLKEGGFDKPVIYADDCSHYQATSFEHMTKYTVVNRVRYKHDQPGIAWANYMMALYDLCIRNRQATRICVFQDDLTCVKNLKGYLDTLPFPQKSYWNLYTGNVNENIANHIRVTAGNWFKSDQYGKGALALVFDREGVETLLGHILTAQRPRSAKSNWVKNIDGWVCEILCRQVGYTEWCHMPSLVQHKGTGVSTLYSDNIEPTKLYREGFDALELVKK